MQKKFMFIVVLVALLGAGWATFPGFAEGGNGDASADRATGRAQDRQDRLEARQDAHQERQDARHERRAALNESIQLHRDCIRAAVLEARESRNATDANDTGRGDASHVGAAARECNQAFREAVQQINSAARERYQLAKEWTREQHTGRSAAAAERDDGDACGDHERCAAHRVAKWEERKDRAEDRLGRLQAELNLTENELRNLRASGNATDDRVLVLDHKVLAIKIRILQIEHMILHIDAKIDKWNEADETD